MSRCLICAGDSRFVAYGVEAPWITELLDDGTDRVWVRLVACDSCDVQWFEPRMASETADALYRNYREPDYLKARRRWEPWYLPAWNSSRDPNSEGAMEVVSELETHIADLPPEALAIVADVGGDAGQFFPRGAVRKLLVDPSDRDVVSGVERVSSLDQLPPGVSLVILGCVLPHVPDPLQFLRDVRTACPQAFVIIQTAHDQPNVRRRHGTPTYRDFLTRIGRSRLAFVVSDFGTGLCKQFGWKLPRFGVVKQSEHINYFSIHSLSRMAESIGYQVRSSHESKSGGLGALRLGSLWILLEPTNRQDETARQRS